MRKPACLRFDIRPRCAAKTVEAFFSGAFDRMLTRTRLGSESGKRTYDHFSTINNGLGRAGKCESVLRYKLWPLYFVTAVHTCAHLHARVL